MLSLESLLDVALICSYLVAMQQTPVPMASKPESHTPSVKNGLDAVGTPGAVGRQIPAESPGTQASRTNPDMPKATHTYYRGLI